MKPLRRRATTLIEMLVVCAIFFIFMMLAGSLIVDMLHSYRAGEELVRPMQQARDAMSLMCDSWRACYNITPPQLPNNVTLQIYSDEIGHTARWVQFYQVDNQLMFEDYRDGPAFPTQERVLVKGLISLDFHHMEKDVVATIDMTAHVGNATTTPLRLQSLVFMRAYVGQP